MIKTKSILTKKSKDDGTRICVMRWVKDFYDYDEWLRELAPSQSLLMDYRNGRINWELFVLNYKCEMENIKSQNLIKSLNERSESGEVITLLCWEEKDDFCHRRILKNLIENENVGMLLRITYYGERGTRYSELDVIEKEEVQIGEWISPFMGTSPAIGFVESLIQSDNCPPIFHNEPICRVKVEVEKGSAWII